MSERKNAKDRIKDVLEPATGALLDMSSGLLLEGVASTVVPGVGNMILSYKQKRMENNIEKALADLVERQDELNAKLEQISKEREREIGSTYFDMMLDYALETKQEEKIEYLVNGFIHICDVENPREDVIMHYYDTLEELTLLDIRLLKLYYYPPCLDQEENEHGDNIFKIAGEYQIDNNELSSLKEKLQRLGLIESKNAINIEKNYEAIIRFLEGKDKKLKTKRISKSESYRITSYGRRFMKFFIEK